MVQVWHSELFFDSLEYTSNVLNWDSVAAQLVLSADLERALLLDLTTPSSILRNTTYDNTGHFRPPSVRVFSELLANQLCPL